MLFSSKLFTCFFSVRPQAVVLSRYTLHSTSLPRPQYPVPVSVAAAVPPSYKRSTTFTSFSSNGSGSGSSNQVQSKLMDTKGAKHVANLYKRGGMMGRWDFDWVFYFYLRPTSSLFIWACISLMKSNFRIEMRFVWYHQSEPSSIRFNSLFSFL